jgi:hypothetical protein
MVQQGNNNVPALQFRQYRFLANSADPAQPPFTTFGHDILQRPYSKRLINLTHQCLAMDPQLRPTPRALLRTVEGMMQNVYQQPPRSVQKTLLNREGGSSASPFNHALLARLTAAEVNAYPNPTSTADDQPPQRNPNWPVPGEDRNIPLAPFVYPANPLKRIRDLNHYPWRDTVQDEGFQPLNVQTRHGNRVSRRLRRRETGM